MVDLVAVTNVSAQQMPQAVSWFMGPFVINLVYAFLILFFGLLVGQLVKKVLMRLFTQFRLNDLIQQTTSIDAKLDQLITSFVIWIIYIVSILFSIRQLGLADEVITVLLSFFSLLVLILIFLSLKDFIPNLISGLLMMFKQYMKPGDNIESRLVKGVVLDCDLLHTSVKTKNGDIIHIPNSYVIRQKLVVKKK